MRSITVLGAGNVGRFVAEVLVQEHLVTVVEPNTERLEAVRGNIHRVHGKAGDDSAMHYIRGL